MSDKDKNGKDNGDEERSADGERSHGFQLGLGLQPLSDLLGSLIEVRISDLPPPENAADWTNGSEQNKEQGRSEVDLRRQCSGRRCESVFEQCRIDTRVSDDVLYIVADIPGATEETLSVGINRRSNAFEIRTDGIVVGRVNLPWKSTEATHARFNNGVLEVRLHSPSVTPD